MNVKLDFGEKIRELVERSGVNTPRMAEVLREVRGEREYLLWSDEVKTCIKDIGHALWTYNNPRGEKDVRNLELRARYRVQLASLMEEGVTRGYQKRDGRHLVAACEAGLTEEVDEMLKMGYIHDRKFVSSLKDRGRGRFIAPWIKQGGDIFVPQAEVPDAKKGGVVVCSLWEVLMQTPHLQCLLGVPSLGQMLEGAQGEERKKEAVNAVSTALRENQLQDYTWGLKTWGRGGTGKQLMELYPGSLHDVMGPLFDYAVRYADPELVQKVGPMVLGAGMRASAANAYAQLGKGFKSYKGAKGLDILSNSEVARGIVTCLDWAHTQLPEAFRHIKVSDIPEVFMTPAVVKALGLGGRSVAFGEDSLRTWNTSDLALVGSLPSAERLLVLRGYLQTVSLEKDISPQVVASLFPKEAGSGYGAVCMALVRGLGDDFTKAVLDELSDDSLVGLFREETAAKGALGYLEEHRPHLRETVKGWWASGLSRRRANGESLKRVKELIQTKEALEGFIAAGAVGEVAMAGPADVLQWALQMGRKYGMDLANTEVPGREGPDYPLHLTVQSGDASLVRVARHGGAKLETRDRHGDTALLRAARIGRVWATETLLEDGADHKVVGGDGADFISLLCRRDELPPGRVLTYIEKGWLSPGAMLSLGEGSAPVPLLQAVIGNISKQYPEVLSLLRVGVPLAGQYGGRPLADALLEVLLEKPAKIEALELAIGAGMDLFALGVAPLQQAWTRDKNSVDGESGWDRLLALAVARQRPPVMSAPENAETMSVELDLA